ncbi:MAG: hypothetical protein ACM3JG_13240 [Thiohalocapsa sp.]
MTGHDTIYSWRCSGPKAAIVSQSFQIDNRGFIANFWKAADQL